MKTLLNLIVGIRMYLLLGFLISFTGIELQAQSTAMDFGNLTAGSVSSGTGTLPSFFFAPTRGTFFYGFSSSASATLKGENPGLLRLGTYTEAQASAGNGAAQLCKFGVHTYATANLKYSFNKFDFVLGGNTGTNTATTGIWYFFAGDGGSGKFMFNNTTVKNLSYCGVALKFTFGSNGAIVPEYYNYSNSNWTALVDAGVSFTFRQTIPYSIEVYSNNDRSYGGSINYSRHGQSYTCAPMKMDIWVNNIRIANQVNVSQYIGQSGTNLKKMDSFCFYGEGSNTAYMFVDNINASSGINNITSYSYYSKSTGNLNDVSTWGTGTDGSGTSPSNFTSDNCTYYIRNNVSPTLGGNWTVSGFNSEVELGDGTNASNFTIPSGFTLSGVIDVVNNGTLTLKNLTLPTIRSLASGSTVDYAYAGDQNIVYPIFYNLKISGTGTKTMAADITASGTVTVGDGTNGILSTSTYGLTGNTNVSNNGYFKLMSSTSNPTFGTIGTGSTVEYGLGSNGQSVKTGNYYNLTFSDYNKTLPSSGTVGIAGTFTTGTATGHTLTGSTVNFNGSTAQTLSSAFTFNNLTVGNTAGLTVNDNISVNGTLYLPNVNASAIKGALDVTDPKILTMGASGTNTGIGEVTGIVKRTSITSNVVYTFGYEHTSLTFSSGGTLPTDVNVKTVLTSSAFYTGAVNRYYDIIRTGGDASTTVNLVLHYLDGELNGNTASNLDIFDYHPSGPYWHDHGRSNINNTDKWVALANNSLMYLAQTSFDVRKWTLSNSVAAGVLWLGAVSTDWNTTSNWTGNLVPGINDVAIIPDATTTLFDPELPATPIAFVRKIFIQSGGILNGGTSTTLDLSGSTGAWINYGTFNPGTSNVRFLGKNATYAGTTDFYNVTVGDTGKLVIGTESIFRISGSVSLSTSGQLYAQVNENTIEYNGTGQTVHPLSDGYHNLILSGSGTKTMPGTAMTLNGDFTTSGTASATAGNGMTVHGNTTIGSGTTFNAGSYSHTLKGNFINNGGTFTASTSTITMDGTVQQTIGGTTASTFYNLTLNNASGVTIERNVAVDRTLTLSDGSLEIGANTLTLNGDVSGSKTIITSSCGTVNYNQSTDSQNILPGNYGNLTFSNYNKVLPSSGTVKIACTFTPGTATGHTITGNTVEFNGSGAQTIPAFSYNNLLISNSGTNITLAQTGTIKIKGEFNPVSKSVYSSAGSTIEFNGDALQYVNSFTFYNLTINNSSGGVRLNDDCNLNGHLALTNGILDTYTNALYFEAPSSHSPETSTSYILGTALMQSRTVGTGTLDFLNCNIQGSADIGDVLMIRLTGPLGIVTAGSNSSIAANWEVITTTTMNGTRNVTYRWPTALDNGLLFTINAQVYYFNTTTSAWEPVDLAKLAVTENYIRSMTIAQTHFSQYTVSNQDSPLPVRLASFSSNVSDRNVKLNWATSKETNNSGFEVERAEVRSQNLEFRKIGYVSGKGTVNTTSNYSYTDTKLNTGKYQFRLKQIDYNGNFEYFELNGNVEVGLPGKFNLSQNYPNPFNPVTKIDFDLPLDSKVNMVMYDISGREIKTLVNEGRPAGYHTIMFDASSLSSGIYFYRIVAKSSDKDFVSFKKMALIK
ncbi:MAG: T9SS type A sorting domain-containing protein [Ignavibacteria bacterium]